MESKVFEGKEGIKRFAIEFCYGTPPYTSLPYFVKLGCGNIYMFFKLCYPSKKLPPVTEF